MKKHEYVPCAKESIPDKVRFDVPRRNQGQTVEVAYGGFGRSEHDEGDLYKRVHDRSLGPEAFRYYKLSGDRGIGGSA